MFEITLKTSLPAISQTLLKERHQYERSSFTGGCIHPFLPILGLMRIKSKARLASNGSLFRAGKEATLPHAMFQPVGSNLRVYSAALIQSYVIFTTRDYINIYVRLGAYFKCLLHLRVQSAGVFKCVFETRFGFSILFCASLAE